MTSTVSIRPERADHTRVGPLPTALDDDLAMLHAPEGNRILDVSLLMQPQTLPASLPA